MNGEVVQNESIWGAPSKVRNHLECYYCGLIHKHVEACGLYSCPNVLCTGPGAAWFRSRQKSYKEVESGRHTVDSQEMVASALAYLAEHDNLDDVIRQKVRESIAAWTKDAP